MTIRVVAAVDVAPQPWRNGGGSTRELLAWPSSEDWSVRISMADISADGPFSSFPGIERWFAVVTGAGVVLRLDGVERAIHQGDTPLRFDGAATPACRLIDGPTRDLNLMTRGGRSVMQPVGERAWRDDAHLRALFTATPGRWTDGKQSRYLQAHTLLWDDAQAGEAWEFAPAHRSAIAGWWLAFTAA